MGHGRSAACWLVRSRFYSTLLLHPAPEPVRVQEPREAKVESNDTQPVVGHRVGHDGKTQEAVQRNAQDAVGDPEGHILPPLLVNVTNPEQHCRKLLQTADYEHQAATMRQHPVAQQKVGRVMHNGCQEIELPTVKDDPKHKVQHCLRTEKVHDKS